MAVEKSVPTPTVELAAQYDAGTHSVIVRIPLTTAPVVSSTGKMELFATFSTACSGPKGRVLRCFGNVGSKR